MTEKRKRESMNARAAEDRRLEEAMAEAALQPVGDPPPGFPPLGRGRAWPVLGPSSVTQEFGPTNFDMEPPLNYQGKYHPHFHKGIDIGAPMGAPVVALDAGKVTYAGGNQFSGVSVIIAHPDGLVTTYHHLDLGARGPTVRPGDFVGAGQVVGYVGVTGMTTGPHLHFVARSGDLVNPRMVLPRGK